MIAMAKEKCKNPRCINGWEYYNENGKQKKRRCKKC